MSAFKQTALTNLQPEVMKDFFVGIRITLDRSLGNDWPLAKVDTLYYDDHHLRWGWGDPFTELYFGSKALRGLILSFLHQKRR